MTMPKKAGSSLPPWEKPNPQKRAGGSSTKLTPAQIAEAKRRAAAAGRPYPNLVDNMAVARMAAKKSKTGGRTRHSGPPD
jgi:hypothetical protein